MEVKLVFAFFCAFGTIHCIVAKEKSEKGFCKETFSKHTTADCILYDDEECDGDEGVKEMRRGGVLLTAKTVLPFDVESVSIRKGCQLTVYTGERLSGEYHIFTAVNDNLHITLDEDEELQKFDDNVNSAICSCMTPIFRHPVGYISTNKFPYYIPARFALRGSFVGEPVSVFTQHRFHSI